MKKIKIFLISAFALLLGLASCSSCDHKTEPIEEEMSLDFNTIIQEDFDYAKENFTMPVFYEAQIGFDDSITNVDYPNVIEIITVIQDFDTITGQPWCYLFTHTLDGCVLDSVNDLWMEDCVINIDSVKLTLEDALTKLHETNIVLPESSIAVLRRPLGPEVLIYPLYIFGQVNTGFVSVNSGTGEVDSMDGETLD